MHWWKAGLVDPSVPVDGSFNLRGVLEVAIHELLKVADKNFVVY